MDSMPQIPIKYSRYYPSREYLEMLLWSRDHHITKKTFDGTRSFHALLTLRTLCQQHRAKTLLDFGSGKGRQYEEKNIQIGEETLPSMLQALGLKCVRCYDPAWAPAAAFPEGQAFDGVLCHDVLQYIPVIDIPWVLSDILSAAKKFVLIQGSCQMGKKPWGDAVSQQKGRSEEWWKEVTLAAINDRDQQPLDVVLRIRLFDKDGKKVCNLWRCLPGRREFVFVGTGNLMEPIVATPRQSTPLTPEENAAIWKELEPKLTEAIKLPAERDIREYFPATLADSAQPPLDSNSASEVKS